MSDLLADLRWRGLLQDATPGLDEHLRGPRVVYCGFDPTAPSLQLGNLVPLMLLRHLQRAGHTPIVLMGGGTGLIGDPSGRRTERPLLGRDQIRDHVARQQRQMGRFLDFGTGPGQARLLDNAIWLEPVPMVAFLRDVGKHFTINVMLQKESVKARLEDGLSYTEFSYMLLQAFDFLQLYRRERCTVQVGGSDQWGNITAGVDLIRRVENAEAHALVAPLVTSATGAKFGKSEADAIFLDPGMTSPYRFYQYWINVDDRDVERYLKLFTLLPRPAINDAVARHAAEPAARHAQRTLAATVTADVHGPEAQRGAAAASQVLFGEMDPHQAAAEAFDTLAAEIPTAVVTDTGLALADALITAGLAKSKAEARRAIEQGGIYVNGARETDVARALGDGDWLHEHNLLLRKGKKDFALLRR